MSEFVFLECEIFAMLANMISLLVQFYGFHRNGGISNTCEVKKGVESVGNSVCVDFQ